MPSHQSLPIRSRRSASRGQVAVIFAGAMLLFAMLSAAVIDLSWYWTNNLRMQRAADAAALAGVVWLPGNPAKAKVVARAEAVKNGYTDGVGGISVTPLQDPTNDRRLLVTISGPVGTYFARIAGITSFPATQSSKADFVLPVPMGSPQNYYGVGFYERRAATQTPVPGTTDWNPAGLSISGGQWATPDAAFTNNNIYTTEDTNNQSQIWTNFADLRAEIPNDATLAIDGIEVRLQDARLTGSGLSSSCRIQVALSWNSGTSWTGNVASAVLTTADTDPVVGSSVDLSMWTNHPAQWTSRDELANGTFRVRLTWQDGITNCASARSVQLDQLEVKVQYHTVTTSWNNQTLTVKDPADGSVLASQGFWGAVFTSGGYRENGDRYAPAYIGGGTSAGADTANPDYAAGGYDYLLELSGGSGQVQLFDPMFCATGGNGHGGSYGAGDHWTSHPGGQVNRPVSVTYRLYNTNGTLTNTGDDGPPVQTLTYDPGTKTMGDMSGNFGDPSNKGAADAQDCSTDPAHNAWVSMASGLVAGTYRLNVNTSSDPDNLNVGAENLFSIWVKSGGSARAYGAGRMAAYTNLDGGLQAFYFAQIERAYAGKMMVIELFDPGEVAGNGYLRLQSPDGNIYSYATFSWRSDDGRSGTNVSQIQTSINGAAQFNNRLVTIEVQLPPTYGDLGLDPPGDATTEAGWWRVEYNVSGGNDTTTWSVNIRGNPVHLVLP
jgi:Flp pilus assembly protein TadG